MIHNTFLVRISTGEILASTKYWPVEVELSQVAEFVATRADLLKADAGISEIPLIIGDDKFHGAEVVKDLLLVYATNLSEDEYSIFSRLEKGAKALSYELKTNGLTSMVAKYEELIEPSVITRLKIALVGEGGVGKTTTLHLLLGDTPPKQYVPTIALNLETVENIRFGNYSLVLWDFAGQERFRTLWKFYFHGADVIFLVCDSTLRNIIISKDILKLIRRDAPKVPVFALANKQDKPNTMKAEVVQKILGIPTYPMVAIDKERRDEMLRILMNAAAQYVGVVLPDLPAADLLKFSDEAAEKASKTESLRATKKSDHDVEYETIEVIEEVYVDEDGHIIDEDSDEFEIIEDIVEEIEETVDDEESFAINDESEGDVGLDDSIDPGDETESSDEDEVAVSSSIVLDEIEEPPLTEEAPSHKPSSQLTDAEIVLDIDLDEYLVGEAEDEVLSSRSETEPGDTSEMIVEVQGTAKTEEVSISVQSESMGIDTTEDDGFELMKELLAEKLDADDIITSEIEKASLDELDIALEALKSDETICLEDDSESPMDIDKDEIVDLDRILGFLDDAPKKRDELVDDADRPDSVDTTCIAEIEKVIDPKQDAEEIPENNKKKVIDEVLDELEDE